MALVAQRLALMVAPEIRQDVFYGALMQHIGSVGTSDHIIYVNKDHRRADDSNGLDHCSKSSIILRWLPGMQSIAQYVSEHHRWYRGLRREDRATGGEIQLGSQILGLVDIASQTDCFRSPITLSTGLHAIAGLTGRAWRRELWIALVESTKDSKFYLRMMNTAALPSMILEAIEEIGVPPALDTDTGVERVLHLFSVLVDLKDRSTAGHSLRTASYAKSLATYMGLSHEDTHQAYRAGLVHDCGRFGIPTDLLSKPGRLSSREMEIVRLHAGMTIKALTCLPMTTDICELANIAGHDHERFDGQGYPDKLQGNDIPLISRILGVADAFDAMVSSTGYRLLTPRGAAVRLVQNAGSQFDPQVVDAMLTMVRESGLLNERQIRAA